MKDPRPGAPAGIRASGELKGPGRGQSFRIHNVPPPGGPINEPSLARGLAAELTAFDVDLIRPDVDRELGWVCGYRSAKDNDEFFEAWRREAKRRGFILVASGDE